MSYIHQALKKAQAQREEAVKGDEGSLPSLCSTGVAHQRWALMALALAGILALAFILYSWLDRGAVVSKAGGAQESRPTVPIPVQGETANADALYQTGRRHHVGGRSAEAKVFYERALQADPGYVPALNNLAVILMAEKDYQGARARLEKAILLDPGDADACYNLACLFALTDQPAQGLRYLKRAVSLNPKVRHWAREDADLERLRKEPGFRELLDG